MNQSSASCIRATAFFSAICVVKNLLLLKKEEVKMTNLLIVALSPTVCTARQAAGTPCAMQHGGCPELTGRAEINSFFRFGYLVDICLKTNEVNLLLPRSI
jgi:hypothetical protein